MFPLLFLVVDSRIVDRYFSFSLAVDMSLSLVSRFSRQTAAEEKKEKCNRSKLSKALYCFVCLYQRTTKEKERKEKKREKNSSSASSSSSPSFTCCTSNNGRCSGRRVVVPLVLLLKSKTYRERERERKKESSKIDTQSPD